MSERRPRRRRLLLGLLGVALAATTGAVAALAATPTIEGTSSTTSWTPSTATVSTGESVNFKDSSASVPHGVHWVSVPETPSCTAGVPIDHGETSWSGSCTFAQAGTYQFRCAVHATMTGTITVSGPIAPVVSTGTGTATSDTAATLSGTVNPSGQKTTYWFEYGTTAAYGEKTTEEPAGEGTAALTREAMVSGLLAGTTYHFRIVAKNASGTTHGSDHTFMTHGPPLVTTGGATGVGETKATLTGTVNPNGHETTYWFEYGTTTGYGHKTTNTSAGAGTANVPASAIVSGLSPETTYHFRLVAENSSSSGQVSVVGADQIFTTSSPPLVTTGMATGIGATEATLTGTVNPEGHATTYSFRYGTTTGYGHETTKTSAGTGTASVLASAIVSGLSPETTYHFQLVAENNLGSGPVPGEDKTFTTSFLPPPPIEELPPPPVEETTPPPPPAQGSALGSAVTVVPGRRGSSVRVDIQVLQPGAGGRLEVDLLTKGPARHAIAGRLVRMGAPAGKMSVSVPLNAHAKSTLRRRHRLPLIVKIKLTPPTGAAVVVRGSVVLRA